ncbi:PfkB family carbohydrate kinase [Cellulomonas fimi]|uniref:PfkB family carbohydrate kinase n=1 Tax=Cellulomonas fimi TaxID=1708 RepID=UPI00234C6A40|nr:PfkB family carbohydrate kinase [Cellulomonas fimi]MDC7122751.1 PfkB family carbohydrate kinase [Cellulomonas fimi]
MSAPRVVVVGDVLLDRDVLGTSDRLCPDAPAPVVDVERTAESPGGAGLAALLCADAGADVRLVAPVADDDAGRRLRAMLEPRLTVVAVGHEGATRSKTRVRAAGTSLVRLDEGGPGEPTDVPLDAVEEALRDADAVLVSDYGGGVTTHPGLRTLLARAAARTPLVWDPHPRGGPPVPRAALVTPNVAEAMRATGSAGGGPDQLAADLCGRWDVDAVVVTAGAQGACLARRDGRAVVVPAGHVEHGDPCGAGDRFAATAALHLATGCTVLDAVVRAVEAATGWVAAGGAAAYRSLPQGSPHTASPERESPAMVRARLGARGPVVATGGCFDLLHAGHVATLDAARRLGGSLVVLLNSDASVRRLKGPTRPLVPAGSRRRVLEALDCVDVVVDLDDDDPVRLLGELRPDVWVKGGDYDLADLPEAQVVQAHGGRVVLVPFVPGWSTTGLVARASAGPLTRPQERA